MPISDIRIEPWVISKSSGIDDFCESIFFIGNGYLGIRGFPGWQKKKQPNDHAIFRAGLFSHISHHITDMVQLPDATTLCPDTPEPDTVKQELNLRTGVVSWEWETPGLRFRMERTAAMTDSQLILVKLTVTAVKDTHLNVQAIADAGVRNLPVHDDQMVEINDLVKLLDIDSLGANELKMSTLAERTPVTICWQLKSDRAFTRIQHVTHDTAVTTLSAALKQGECWTIEKHVRILVGKEAPHATSADPWADSIMAWEELWENCDIRIQADDRQLQGAIRYNIFQLLCSNAADEPNISIGARGLTHGRYKGNTFWDAEIFLVPFFTWTRPQAARNLLKYRVNRLSDAKSLAKKQNLAGARFPWMCSSDGTEQCESWDIGLCEVHITADIAYAMDRYVRASGDSAFLRDHAAQVYRETARYWLSRLTWEPNRGCFSSFFVKGPDEYCGATINNTYTNWMARHNIALALENSRLDAAENSRLSFAKEHITLLYDLDRDLFLQDEQFERLEPAPFLKTDDAPSYKVVCFDRMQRYRVIKQADLVLLMTLFPKDFTLAMKRNVFTAYEPLTLHDSTLSWGIHALLAARLGMWEKATSYFERAVYLDLKDLMGNTGHEGLHMGALGAAWQAVVYGMAGLWTDGDGLSLNPMLPPGVERLRFKVWYQGERFDIDISPSAHSLRKEEK